jgi:hypothetical protein
MLKLLQKFQPLEFGKLDYLKNIIENCFKKKYKMAEQSKMSLPPAFLFLAYNFLISQLIRKTKYILNLGFLSIFICLQKMIFKMAP